ncbi:hypothetical protein [Haloplanus halophilus]|uniref:hypothetical protein n=1 Tax=Haloplanus halophilus TaxID=2949993 RepID=UPI0020400553|nr:hypothetical protein [Haloplanus sp. GDY1]
MSGMLARRWVLAARFHEPSDYGIPEAPVFPARCASGTLSLRDPATGDLVMVAGDPMRVRR